VFSVILYMCGSLGVPDRAPVITTYYLIATQLIAGGTSLIQLVVASLAIVLGPGLAKVGKRKSTYLLAMGVH